MPVNTDAIQTILQAWDQGVNQARARQIQASQDEQRKIENQQRERQIQEQITQNKLAHQLAMAQFNLQKARMDVELGDKKLENTLKTGKAYAMGEIGSTGDFPMGLSGTEMGAIPGTGVIENALNQMSPVGAQLAKSIANSQIKAPGTKYIGNAEFAPGTLIEPEEYLARNPIIQGQLRKERIDAAVREAYNQNIIDEKIAARISSGEQKQLDRESREALAKIAAGSKISVAEIMAAVKLANAGNTDKQDISTRNQIFREHNNHFLTKISQKLATDEDQLEKYSKNINKLTGADDTALTYIFARVMDPESSVRDGERKVVSDNANNWAEALGVKFNRALGGTQSFSVSGRKKIIDTIRDRLQFVKQQYQDFRETQKFRLMDTHLSENEIEKRLPDMTRKVGKSSGTSSGNIKSIKEISK